MKRVCVFCGSGVGARPEYLQAATDLGQALVDRGVGLVYGGANVGTMDKIASTVLEAGGDVIGVMPEALVKKEVANTALKDLRVVGSMHERKALMNKLSNGFIALPGGLGTIEEFFEVLAWGQLGIHTKPAGVLNVLGFYDNLLNLVDHAVAEGFMQRAHREMILTHDQVDPLLDLLESYDPPTIDKAAWIKAQHNS